MWNRSMRKLFVLVLMVWQPAAAGQQAGSDELWVARFSSLEPGPVPAEFRIHRFSKIERETVYELVESESGTVLKAASDAAASALIKKVRVDPRRFPLLEWSWRIENLIPEARWEVRNRDDFAVRLFVIFETKAAPSSVVKGFFKKLAGALPGRALNYAWGHPDFAEFAPSPHTGEVVMVPVQHSPADVGQWVVEKRNVLADYRRAFEDEPSWILGIAVMTDTDDTGGKASAFYGDIRFLPAAPSASEEPARQSEN